MRRRPPWKAESARIRAEITARKKQEIPIEAKAITIRTEYPITLRAVIIENPFEGPWMELPDVFYRRKLTDKILVKIREEELISIKQISLPGGISRWEGTLRVVI